MLKPQLIQIPDIQINLDIEDSVHHQNVTHYLHLTKITMPELAKTTRRHWPVINDHCFQRIVLDSICGGVWNKKIARPAYRNMTEIQAQKAVQLCDQIIKGKIDLDELNRQSLIWRSHMK